MQKKNKSQVAFHIHNQNSLIKIKQFFFLIKYIKNLFFSVTVKMLSPPTWHNSSGTISIQWDEQ